MQAAPGAHGTSLLPMLPIFRPIHICRLQETDLIFEQTCSQGVSQSEVSLDPDSLSHGR